VTTPTADGTATASASASASTIGASVAGNDALGSTTELNGHPLTDPGATSGAGGLAAAQAATDTPLQAAAASTTAQASLDAAMSSNPEASADAGVGAGAGISPLSVPGVPMQEMIDSIGATIELAARQGIAKARIELQPEELGHISIRLSQTSEGLRARVTADTPAAAQALTQGRGELRQTLSSLGLSLLQLDIGSSGQPQSGEQDERFASQADGLSAAGASDPAATPEEDQILGGQDGGRPTGVPLGEIVDVLA
jgi:flagellar hook-length control protein FliK